MATLFLEVDTSDVKKSVEQLTRAGFKVYANEAENANERVQKSFDASGESVFSFANVVRAQLVGLMTGFIKDTLTAQSTLQATMRSTLGNVNLVSQELERLTEIAYNTPFQTGEVVRAFTTLTSLGLEPTTKRLMELGDVVTAMNKPLDDMVEAIADAASGEFERLREVLKGSRFKKEGDIMIATFKGVETQVDLTMDAITDWLGVVSVENFAGSMEEQMQVLPGLLSNLEATFLSLITGIGDAGLTAQMEETLKVMIEGLEYLKDNVLPFLADNWGIVSDSVIAFVAAISIGPLLASITAAVRGLATAFVFLTTTAGGFLTIAGSVAAVLVVLSRESERTRSEMEGLVKSAGDLNKSFGQLRIDKLEDDLHNLEFGITGLWQQIVIAEKAIDDTTMTLDRAMITAGVKSVEAFAKLGAEQLQLVSAVNAAEKAHDDLKQRIGAANDAANQYEIAIKKEKEELERLNNATENNTTSTKKNTLSKTEQNRILKEQAKRMKLLADAMELNEQQLVNSAIEYEKESEAIAKTIKELETQLELVDLETEEREFRLFLQKEGIPLYRAETEEVRKLWEQVQQSEKAFKIATDNAKIFRDVLVNSIRNVSDSFVDSLTDMFTGTTDSFEDFKDDLIDTAKRMIAELIQTFVNQRIIVPIFAQVSGGAEGGAAGLFGGQAGTHLGRGLAGAGIGGIVGGGSTASLVAGGLGGIGGGLAGSAIAGSAALTGSAFATGGALGSVLPGIGTIIGAGLAGVIASIFGGGSPDPGRFTVASRSPETGLVTATGAFGDVYSGVPFASDPENSNQVAIAIAEMDNALAQFLTNDEIGRITDSLSGMSFSESMEGLNIDNIFQLRFIAILEQVDQEMADLFDDLADSMNPEQMASFVGGMLEIRQMFEEGGQLFTDVATPIETINVLLEEFTNEGESLTETLNRVNGSMILLRGLNPLLDDFDTGMAQIATGMVDALGGIDAATAAINQFETSFFSAEEQTERFLINAVDPLADQLEALGLDADTSIEEFRTAYDAMMQSVQDGEEISGEAIAAWVQAGNALHDVATAEEELNNIRRQAEIEEQTRQIEEHNQAIQDQIDVNNASLEVFRSVRDRRLEELDVLNEEVTAAERAVEAHRELLGVFYDLADSTRAVYGDLQTAYENSNRTALQNIQAQRGITDALLANKNINSVEDIRELNSAVSELRRQELALLSQIDGAINGIEGGFGSLIDSINATQMTDEERYAAMEQEAESLANSLDTLTDPAEIEAATTRIEQLTRNMWNLLGDDQQTQEMADGFTTFLQDVMDQATDQLEDIKDDIIDDSGTREGLIEDTLDDAATRLEDAGTKLETAAEALRNSATELSGTIDNLDDTIEDLEKATADLESSFIEIGDAADDQVAAAGTILQGATMFSTAVENLRRYTTETAP